MGVFDKDRMPSTADAVRLAEAGEQAFLIMENEIRTYHGQRGFVAVDPEKLIWHHAPDEKALIAKCGNGTGPWYFRDLSRKVPASVTSPVVVSGPRPDQPSIRLELEKLSGQDRSLFPTPVGAPKLLEWCWSEVLAEHAHGPFPTREACLKDAAATLREDVRAMRAEAPAGKIQVSVGHVCPIVPEDHISADLNLIFEQMETSACDNGAAFDDTVFDLAGDTTEAEEALDVVLRNWAREWVTSTFWVMGGPVEEVEITL